jgi:protein-tyrosine phosphatase
MACCIIVYILVLIGCIKTFFTRLLFSSFKSSKLDHIIDNIYLGNWRDSINEEKLKANGIKCILTLNKEYRHNEKDMDIFDKLSIQQKYIELYDSTFSVISPYLEESMKFIKKCNGNVLVHCTAGVSRSASVVIYYLMKEKNMTYSDALYYVRNKRPIVNPNRSFVQQLKELEGRIS